MTVPPSCPTSVPLTVRLPGQVIVSVPLACVGLDAVMFNTTLPQVERPFGSRPAGLNVFTEVYVPTGSVATPVTGVAGVVRAVADGVVGMSTVDSRSDPQADAIPAAASS